MPAFTRKQRLLLNVLPPIAAGFIRLLGSTLSYRDINALNTPIGIEISGPVIFAFWHQCLLVCAYRFRNTGIAILISPSFDGELIARTVARLGFFPVRGSSSRGGATGLRNMADAYNKNYRCAFTADGPRGPSHIAKSGPVQLAQLTQATWIGAFHAQPDSAWHLKSWDGFIVPKPFSTITFSWPAHCAPELNALQASLDRAVAMSGREQL